jgi:GTPase Era involved in 16S rRNA processing
MKTISDFAETRDYLLSQLDVLTLCVGGIQKDLSLAPIKESIIEPVAGGLKNEHFVIAVVGVIKRGKSTLLNALLGVDYEILPTKVTPETARLCFLKYAVKPIAVVHKLKGGSEEIDLKDLPKYTSAYGSGSFSKNTGIRELVENTKYAEVHYPNKYLQDGVIIVDTPGVDDPDRSRSQVTEDFISSADAVIFMIDAVEGGLKESELNFLKARIINSRSSKGIIVVANKILALRRHQKPELAKLLLDTKKKLETELEVTVPIYQIDARAGFQAKGDRTSELWGKSQFGEFLDGMESMLLANKGRFILSKGTLEILSQIVTPTMEALNYEFSVAPDNIKQLEQELVLAKSKLHSLAEQFKHSHKSFENRIRNLKSSVAAEIHASFGTIDPSSGNVQSQFAKKITQLNGDITKKLANVMNEYVRSIEAKEIKLPELKFHIKNPNLDINSFFTKEQTSEVNVSDKAGIRAAQGALLGSLFAPGIGTLIGGVIGWFSEMESEEKTTKTFDEFAFQKKINKVVAKLITSYEDQCDAYSEYFKNSITSWFDNQTEARKSKQKSIESAKMRKQAEYAKRRDIIAQYLNELRSVESNLITIQTKLQVS